jgi:ferritin-like metal-binding protein YciE
MTADDIDDLFEHELEDIYFAEHELTEAYDRMAETSTDEAVVEFFETHVEETGTHIERLVEVFEQTGEAPQTEECEGIEGLLAEWEEFAEANESGDLHDYYNLVTAMKTERYEQTAYESLVALADARGDDEAEELLRENLDEDEATLDELAEMTENFDYDSL